MRLYTRKGDDGQTDLLGKYRVGKDDPRVEAYGAVDELNALIGLAVACCPEPEWSCQMREIQSQLFALGADLADPDAHRRESALETDTIANLEAWIDNASREVAPLKNFILPGGTELTARFHHARTVCRRAERRVVRLAGSSPVAPVAVTYLNRLSDLLFAFARLANHRSGTEDLVWRAPHS